MLIQLLGSPAILIEGRRLEHPSQKAMALLAYLALRADEHVSRNHLAGLLWADSGEEQARANLRQTLSQLRKLFSEAGVDPILVPFDKVVLSSDKVDIDVRIFLDNLESLSLNALAETPAFLEGFMVRAPEFETWLSTQRRIIRTRVVAHLEALAKKSRAAGRLAEASEALSLALSLDPLQEIMHRTLMEVLAAQGRSDEALQQYEACQKILARELQIEPDAETRQLASRIRGQRLASPSAAVHERPFNRYPPASPATILVVGTVNGESLHHFAVARDALTSALEIRRNADDPFAVAIAVVHSTGDQEEDRREARTILQDAERGSVIVTSAIYDQFEHWSPFAFGERRSLNSGHKVHSLISEITRHRLLVLPTVETPRVAPASEFSVAILPLVDRSPDASDYGLGDHFSEEVTHRLSRYRGLTAAAPSAAQSFRSFGYPLDQSRHMLGVNYLVDGNILRESDQLQIRLTVTDLRDNRLVFSHRFDGAVADFLFGQGDLVDQIASAIFHRTQGAEVRRAERAPTENMTAYDWFLRGLAAHRRSGIMPDNARRAFANFTRAIDLDPRFARAIAWRLCAVSWFNWDYILEPGMRQIQEALSIDEEDAEVQRIAGALHLYSGDGEQGLRHIERAVELNPSDAYLMASSAVYWAYYGEPAKGLKHIERAMALDPFLPAWCVEDHGVVLYAMGEFEASIASLTRLAFPSPRALAYMAASQVAANQSDAGQATIARLRRVSRDFSASRLLATAYYRRESDRTFLRERLNAAGLE